MSASECANPACEYVAVGLKPDGWLCGGCRTAPLQSALAEGDIAGSAVLAAQEALGEVVDGQVVYEVVPWTGEALQLSDMTDEQLAEHVDQIVQFQAEVDRHKISVGQVLLERMDEQLEWTLHAPGGWKVTGPSPEAHTEYDEGELRATLTRLIEAGLVGVGAIEDVFVPKKGFDISKRGLNKLMKLGGPVKDALEMCKRSKHTPRRVSVTRDVS